MLGRRNPTHAPAAPHRPPLRVLLGLYVLLLACTGVGAYAAAWVLLRLVSR